MTRLARTLILAFAAALPAWAEPLAFFSDLKGGVTVDGTARPQLLSEVARGQKIALAADGRATVMYVTSGREFVLKGPGDYVVREAEVASASGAAAASRPTEWRASGKVLAQVAQTSGASVRMRSLAKPAAAEPAQALQYPVQGHAATLQPVFRWTMPDAKAPAEITLFVDGHEQPVLKARAPGGAYKPPSKLKPETEYAWKITVGDQEIGIARFRTLSAAAAQALEARRPAANAAFSDRVLFAMALQDAGANQDAREAWGALARERSDLPELAALAK